MNTPINVLLVEDNDGDARLIREMCADAKSAVTMTVVKRLDEALARVKTLEYDAVLLDLNLPDSQGVDTLHTLVTRVPHLPIVVLTGIGDELLAMEAVGAQAQDYLNKGEVDARILMRALRYAIERKKIEKELWDKMHHIEGLNELMLQREMRIIEIKREVNELLKELGRDARYMTMDHL